MSPLLLSGVCEGCHFLVDCAVGEKYCYERVRFCLSSAFEMSKICESLNREVFQKFKIDYFVTANISYLLILESIYLNRLDSSS